MFSQQLLQHTVKLITSREYHAGYAFAVNNDAYFDMLTNEDLLKLAMLFMSNRSAFSDGQAYYCWELAYKRKGLIADDTDTNKIYSSMV